MKRDKNTKATRRRLRHKRLRKLRAACLSVGLATAWGGTADADVTFGVRVTPERTITNAYVYFTNNATSGWYRSLGTLPAGQTSASQITFTDLEGDFLPLPGALNGDWDPGFTLLGIYEQDDLETGVVISSGTSELADAEATWDELFYDAFSDRILFTEEQIASAVAGGGRFRPEGTSQSSRLRGFFDPRPGEEGEFTFRTPYGQTATLNSFSSATDIGSIVIFIVPEPATFAFIACAAVGVAATGTRRRA